MEGCLTVSGSEHPESEDPAREAIPEEDESRTEDVHLRNLIETYETLPELWDPAHPSYVNRTQRNGALDKLANIYRKIKLGVINELKHLLSTFCVHSSCIEEGPLEYLLHMTQPLPRIRLQVICAL